MDGINSGGTHGMVMVLATTNKPWDLDDALRRRLEKRIYIPVPDAGGRAAAFAIHLRSVQLDGECGEGLAEDARRSILQQLGAMTEGYSGADVRSICREAAMMPMRRLMEHHSATEIAEMKQNGSLDERLCLTMEDFKASIQRTQSSLDTASLAQYETWDREFGAT